MTVSDPALLKRCAIAVAALTVYGAGATWAVRHQAESYRASLRPGRAETPVPIAEARPEVPAPAAAAPEKALPPRAHEGPKKPAGTAPTRPLPPPDTAKVTDAPKRPNVTASSESTAAPAPSPIWNDPGVTKVYDPARMTADEEMHLGAALNRLILDLNPQAVGSPSDGRIHLAAQPILEKRARKEVRYQFFVLDSPEPNIFSTPGGYIYVTEGLMRWFGEDEDHALQFFLAHEVAHVDNRHALECLRIPELREAVKAVGTAELLYREILPRAYFDGHEFAADRWALRCLSEMGLGRLEKLAALRKLETYARSNNFLQGHVRPDPTDAERSILDNHLRAHVSAAQRLSAAKAFVDGKPTPAPSR